MLSEGQHLDILETDHGVVGGYYVYCFIKVKTKFIVWISLFIV